MSIPDITLSVRARQAGISLIELILFIVIVSIGIAGILSVINVTTRNSADPLMRKQALAIAESILEEVQLMPFTYCDPNDPKADTATSAADCSAGMDQNNAGNDFSKAIPGIETRYGTTDPFDNVADYAGFSMDGINDITNSPIAGLGSYRLQKIGITRTTLPDVPNGAALLITVTVTDPSGQNIVLEGIRTRYAPRALP
jgi:MSHA pilin protein MshD